MKKFCFLLLLLCSALFSSADNSKNESAAKTTIAGKVVDNMGQEVAGAKVLIIETGETVYTDFNGCFKITVQKKRQICPIR